MSITDKFAGPARRFLAGRLRQLAFRLEQLGGLLRERIAGAIGHTVAETVREAVRAALADRDSPATSPYQHEPDRAWDYPVGPAQHERYDVAESDGLGWEPLPAPAPPAPPQPRWRQALWAGLQAAAWWLRTRPCRRPVATALCVGAAVGLAGALAGTTAAILVGCVGTALTLVALADAARDAVWGLLGLSRA